MRFIIVLLTATLTLQSSSIFAATAYKSALLEALEVEIAGYAGVDNLMYLEQAGPWNGSASCAAGAAYFDAKANPHFAATALAARASDRTLRVFVDDTLPKINGYCRVINLLF